MASDRELFLEFQQKWNKEKVQNISLEEYTGLMKENNRDDFTYWIEFKLDNIGQYSGVSENRGIYKYETKPSKKSVLFDDKYAWLKKYGDTAQEAFKNIKNNILQIIEFSQTNQLEKIDEIDLGAAYKWKIAFHYQNIDDMKILDIFKEEAIREIYKNEFDLKLENISEFHRKILHNNEKFKLEQVLDKARYYYGEKYPKLFSKNIFWAVGFTWGKISKFDDFLKNNIWEYGWGDEKDNKLLKKIKKDDIFVMKSSSTKGSNHDMPFTRIKAIGIVKEKIDSYVFEVNWLKVEEKDFDGIVYRKTIEKIRDDEIFKYVKNSINNKLNNAVEQNSMKNLIFNKNFNKPLNQILYGPPGTGKTYNTIVKAMEIIDDKKYENIEEKEYEALKKRFDDLKQKGQIEFITFHQSYGYEEFVEGIKPVFDDENSQTKKLRYEIKNGIFKEISKKALKNLENSQKTLTELNLEIDLENSWNEYVAYLNEKISNGENVLIKENSKMKIINADEQTISISTGENNSYQGLSKTIFMRDYDKFIKDEIKSYKDIKPAYESRATFHGNAIYYFELFKQISKFVKNSKIKSEKATQEQEKPYILIIDEINRGNISKIFGELITLIEDSKRVGKSEELKVKLPYSGAEFGVPKNLYIIGTMNTADRSIALIDTALRRRFEFVEMMPKAENLSENIDGVNLQKLLNAINERIEFLLDREHAIGHAYFIGVANLSDLRKAFKNKIIPLLQEYFYDDYEKIRAVLNDNGMITDKPKPKFNGEFSFIDDGKMVYQICKFDKLTEKNFIKIYDNSVNLKEQNEQNEPKE